MIDYLMPQLTYIKSILVYVGIDIKDAIKDNSYRNPEQKYSAIRRAFLDACASMIGGPDLSTFLVSDKYRYLFDQNLLETNYGYLIDEVIALSQAKDKIGSNSSTSMRTSNTATQKTSNGTRQCIL